MRGDQQRWRLEQRLCLLLPSALLPCTIKLLRSAAGKGVEEHTKEVGCAGGLIEQCYNSLVVAGLLTEGGGDHPGRPPQLDWVGEVLGGVLQLADQLLLQQQPQAQLPSPAVTAASSAAPGNSQGSSSSSNTTPTAPTTSITTGANGVTAQVAWAMAGSELLKLLLVLVYRSGTWWCRGHSTTAYQ